MLFLILLLVVPAASVLVVKYFEGKYISDEQIYPKGN